MAVGRDRQRLQVDRRIFPDLGIDQPPEREGEGAFEQPLAAQVAMAVDGGAHRTGGNMCHARALAAARDRPIAWR
mgnify:CR=1 FL=1